MLHEEVPLPRILGTFGAQAWRSDDELLPNFIFDYSYSPIRFNISIECWR